MARRKRTPEENTRREKIRELLQLANVGSMDDIQELFKDTIAEFMENGLEAELDDQLGYSRYDYKNKDTDNSRNGYSSKTLRTSFGDVEVSVPRDRKSEFDPKVLRKNQTSISQDIEEKILSMYAKGMSTGDIEAHIQDIYGVDVSDTTVSRITDKILPVAKEWQQRPLESIYAVVFLDAIHYHVRSEGQIVKKAVYIAIGIDLDGRKDVLGMWVGENESAKFWTTEDIAELKAQVQEMQMQIDILKETINALKKAPGIDQTALRNQEKAAIIDALKNKYSLPELLSALHCPRSSYYYQQKRAKKQDKYCHVKEKIKDIFESNHRCYGYRRIYATLKKEGLRLSEKVIRRLMKQVGVQGVNRKKTSYSSYQGEITPDVPNLLKRDFHANRPNEKWLTDITEFAIPAGKVYLSPIIDCFDGMPVCWSIGISPNAELTNGMLDKAISLLKVGEHPVVHTDRGCHYRWPGWISRMEAAHLHRSMSKKGCSPDNSACEGFFGRMKNEMFYGVSWLNVSIEEFIHTVEDYMVWYREKRIKISLGGLSPLEYRQNSAYRHSPRFRPHPLIESANNFAHKS